jgi:hypothetical protein
MCFVGFLLAFQSVSGKAAEIELRSQAITELQPLPAGITLPVQMGEAFVLGR